VSLLWWWLFEGRIGTRLISTKLSEQPRLRRIRQHLPAQAKKPKAGTARAESTQSNFHPCGQSHPCSIACLCYTSPTQSHSEQAPNRLLSTAQNLVIRLESSASSSELMYSTTFQESLQCIRTCASKLHPHILPNPPSGNAP
jgi:hypothetical protein